MARFIAQLCVDKILWNAFFDPEGVFGMDFRVVIVLLPIILAGSWAAFNIFRAALGQIQRQFSDN